MGTYLPQNHSYCSVAFRHVSVFDLRRTFEDPLISEFHIGDICSASDVQQACKGKTVVIHTASPPHGLPSELYFKVNVEGTNNVIHACVQEKVPKLVYTSSASVIFNGGDLINANESQPYCKVTWTLIMNQKPWQRLLSLKANGQGGLLTTAIRPSGIFGPRDMQGSYAMVQAAQRGQWRVMIGDNENLFDMTFVENAAYAHILAADKLALDNGVSGRVGILLGSISDALAWILKPIKTFHPTFTKFRVEMITANRYFDIQRLNNV
ncbi:hypothetical protein BASA84_000408 [Batrachochytrium salamandrivorans]|nr:hypothetical protein BASA84_000408 [Batrachochytrium salamandrivorans]